MINLEILALNKPYINLKKLTSTTSIRKGEVDDRGLKTTYIIDQKTNNLLTSDDFRADYTDGIEKLTYATSALDNTILIEVNYNTRTGNNSAKFKAFAIINEIKYAIPYSSFENEYSNFFNILNSNIKDKVELEYVTAGFNNLKSDELKVDIKTNLDRLSAFKDKVDYRRNIKYHVLNNTLASISKFDIRHTITKIKPSKNIIVLKYNFSSRLYKVINTSNDFIKLTETDIICDLSDKNYPLVSMYTSYGLAKLLDIKNNIIPVDKNINLFANILDLRIPVLR